MKSRNTFRLFEEGLKAREISASKFHECIEELYVIHKWVLLYANEVQKHMQTL